MKLTDDQLHRAAALAQERLFSQLPQEEQCQHIFSEQFEQNMQRLIAEWKQGNIQPDKVHMGWQYYTRNGIAAVLLCFLLACFTMPEVVQAGCQRIIEAVETVFEEYTEYRYHSDAAGDTEFVPLQFGYLPEGMVETDRDEQEALLYLFYESEKFYFLLNQEQITSDDAITYIVDTEDAMQQVIEIQGEDVQFIYKENRIQFIWLHGACRITGQTNLSEDEVIKILENVEFGENDFTPNYVEKEMNYETIEPEYIYQYLLDRGVSEEKLNRLSFNTLESIFRQAEANQFTDIQVQQYIDGQISIMESPRSYSGADEAVLSEDGSTFITSYGEVPNLMQRYHGKYTGEHPTEVEKFYSDQ